MKKRLLLMVGLFILSMTVMTRGADFEMYSLNIEDADIVNKVKIAGLPNLTFYVEGNDTGNRELISLHLDMQKRGEQHDLLLSDGFSTRLNIYNESYLCSGHGELHLGSFPHARIDGTLYCENNKRDKAFVIFIAFFDIEEPGGSSNYDVIRNYSGAITINTVDYVNEELLELEERISALESWRQTVENFINALKGWLFFELYENDNLCVAIENECVVPCVDNDGDGFNAGNGDCGSIDCDDNDNEVYPGAPELCDEKDNDCDGEIDEDNGDCEEGYICMNGECNPPPREDCTTKESDYYCSDSGRHSIEKDYYTCQSGHGSSTDCEPGFCRYRTRYDYCRDGCDEVSGECN